MSPPHCLTPVWASVPTQKLSRNAQYYLQTRGLGHGIETRWFTAWSMWLPLSHCHTGTELALGCLMRPAGRSEADPDVRTLLRSCSHRAKVPRLLQAGMRGEEGVSGSPAWVCWGTLRPHGAPQTSAPSTPWACLLGGELTAVSPQQYGLYSAFMGCFVYLLLGTSRDVTLGPTAIMSLLVSSYTFHEPAYAVLLAFLSGCIQLTMSFLGLGETPGPSCCGGGGGPAVLLFAGEPSHLPFGDALLLTFPSWHCKGYPCEGGVGVPQPPAPSPFCLGAMIFGGDPRVLDPSSPFLLSKPTWTVRPPHPHPLSQPVSTQALWDQLSVPP